MKERKRPTTPEQEGIEIAPDAWERFESTVDKVVKAPPAHRAAKPVGANQPKARGRTSRARKSR